MHCFVRQRAVCRAGNAHAGEVKVIDAAGSEGKLLLMPNGESDVYKIACIVGLFIVVALLAEDL